MEKAQFKYQILLLLLLLLLLLSFTVIAEKKVKHACLHFPTKPIKTEE